MADKFPASFIFATATAAYQVEGGYDLDGRGRSTWDEIRSEKGRIADDSDPRLSCQGRLKYKEDVQLLKELKVTHYRFSVSWPRVMADGTAATLNEAGIGFYRSLCEELVANGVQPIVTLFHTDMPLSVYDSGSWLNPETSEHFIKFCQVCFERLGDLVKYWITFNEIGHQCWYAVTNFEGMSWHSPTRPELKDKEQVPYKAAHHMLLAHAAVYRLYEEKFKQAQKGQVGITNSGRWCVPNSENADDVEACRRAFDWNFNWTIEPILKGDYPRRMRERLPFLPTFDTDERRRLLRSADFVGLNYYLAGTVRDLCSDDNAPSAIERHAKYDGGDERWEKICGETWIRYAPDGLTAVLNYMRTEYDNVPVLITENGCMDVVGCKDVDPLEDSVRVRYIRGHIDAVADALGDGCNVIGYTVWSLMDNFEWDDGFALRFGICRVDYADEARSRKWKRSAHFYRDFLQQFRSLHHV